MAHFVKGIEGFDSSRMVVIKGTENVENYTVYNIEVHLGQYKWTVKHRYSEFHDLHEKLVSQYKINKNLLPPKKIFGNQTQSFIKKRQQELENYLHNVLCHLVDVPGVLADFLLFKTYEIHGITQVLAEELYHKGDLILQAGEIFHVTPLQLHAISTRLTLPEPTCESGDARKDIGHILDFITRVKYLKVQGNTKLLGSSNIVNNQLNFDLTSFKALESLELNECNPEKIHGVDNVKKQLKRLHIHHTVKAIKDILLLDVGHGQWQGVNNESVLVPAWLSLTAADFSHNSIMSIDESVKLLPRLASLDLSHNSLISLEQLHYLSSLTHVDVSYNLIRQLDMLHTRLGNIKALNLAGNKLESLAGFSKLYSLESLDLSHNEISQVVEVRHISSLPCLEDLNLAGNPVTIVLDYRTKVLESFGDRAKEVKLDGVKPSQKELDTVAILLALQKAKEGREKSRKHHKKPARVASIADAEAALGSSSHGNHGQSSTQQDLHMEGAVQSWDVAGTTAQDNLTSDLPGKGQVGEGQRGREGEGESYRSQVEKLRAQGGAVWLSLLNQVNSREHSREPSPTASQSPQRGSPSSRSRHGSPHHSKRGTSDDRMSRKEQQKSQNGSTLGHQSNMIGLPSHGSDFMLPETLPGRNDVNFLSHLQMLTPDSHSLTQLSGIGHDQREERAVHLIWCPVVCYTNPYKQLPHCIYITTENVHILEVVCLKGDLGFPEMDHIYCVPLMNIKQIVLGYQSQYIRIEEAFVGPQGTFTLLTGSQNKTDLFLDSLKLAYRRAIPDLDQYEDPHIVVNGETDLNMKQTLNKIEVLDNVGSIDAVLYLLVQSVDLSNPKKPFMTFSLVMTNKYLYLLREDYILWPQPTFGIGPSMRPQFEIASVFPVGGRITGIQMYDSDTYSPDQDISMSQNFTATNISAMVVPKFIGFGVKLTFDLGGQGSQELDIRVSTSGMRDKFLATLTQVRKEKSERSPSLTKPKSKVKVKEVEADTLSTSSSSSGHGGAKSKVKGEKKRSRKEETALSSHSSTTSLKQIMYNTIDPPYEEIDPMCILNGSQPDADSQNTSRNNSSDAGDTLDFANLPRRESPTGESSTTVESLAIDRLDLPPPTIPQIRRTPPPASLNVGLYPTMKLLGHLTESNESMDLLETLSIPLQNLASMTGEEILNFFHSNVAQIGVGTEEVKHLLWTSVIPYATPLQEMPVCLILSTKAIYFISDKAPKALPGRQLQHHTKTHARHRSDSYKVVKQDPKSSGELHHVRSSGILHDSSTSGQQKCLRAYHVLSLKDIQEVHMGFFDQAFRLTGSKPEDVLACVTRDNSLTETFIKYLMEGLSGLNITPSPDVGNVEGEQDFYKMFNKYQRTESLEFTHPSKVRFVYPSDDSITELTYLVSNSIKGRKPRAENVTLLLYLLLYQMDSIDGITEIDTRKGKPRTVVLTDEHIAIATEDHVSYPLPQFTKCIPEQPQMDIQEVRNIEFLKRIVVSDFTSHDITLVFADETDEVVVDSSVEYFSPKGGAVDSKKEQTGEVAWYFVVQNSKDKDRLIKCLSRQWAEKHDGEELSVQVSA